MDEDNSTADVPLYRPQPLGIFHRDCDGTLLAGLTGQFVWDWLYVDILWVAPSLQRQGLGAQLMQQAEAQAAQRNCGGVWVWTQSFEAPGFYQKQGYEIFCQFPDFPKGHQRIGIRKIFSAETSARKAG